MQIPQKTAPTGYAGGRGLPHCPSCHSEIPYDAVDFLLLLLETGSAFFTDAQKQT
jgi:hypothetical protein